jgi:hypothetical protein
LRDTSQLLKRYSTDLYVRFSWISWSNSICLRTLSHRMTQPTNFALWMQMHLALAQH